MDHLFSRPIIQLAESIHRTHEICIPAYSYSRFVSPGLTSFNNVFYNTYLQGHNDEYIVHFFANCGYSHTLTRFCLPYLYSPYELNFLIDFLVYTPQVTISPSLFLFLIRLCDYLLLNPAVIIDMIYLYIPQNFANRSYLEALVDILNATSYRDLGLEFAANYFTLLWRSAFSIGLHLSHKLTTCACGLWLGFHSRPLDEFTGEFVPYAWLGFQSRRFADCSLLSNLWIVNWTPMLSTW